MSNREFAEPHREPAVHKERADDSAPRMKVSMDEFEKIAKLLGSKNAQIAKNVAGSFYEHQKVVLFCGDKQIEGTVSSVVHFREKIKS